nr:hypothetical protein [uncultured Oscillibacter sp.]
MKAIRKFLWGCWYLIWSCVPGCGQMCLGYMKRGISQTIIFCAVLFIAVFLEMGALAVLILPLWAYSFFDSFNLRRQLRDGGAPEDTFMFGLSEMDARKLSQILARRGSLIGWLLVAVGAYSLYMTVARNLLAPWRGNWLTDWLYDTLVWDMPRILGTVLIIALGIWFIKGPKAPKDGGFDDGPAYTPPKNPPKPPKMKATPWTEAEEKFHGQPEPQAPEVPQAEETAEPAPVVLEWKSEFNVEKYEKELQEKQEADHDGR